MPNPSERENARHPKSEFILALLALKDFSFATTPSNRGEGATQTQQQNHQPTIQEKPRRQGKASSSKLEHSASFVCFLGDALHIHYFSIE
jgi:hypothetical protein